MAIKLGAGYLNFFVFSALKAKFPRKKQSG